MHHPNIGLALERFAEEEIPEDPPLRLPLLDAYRGYKGSTGDYADVEVLFIQHHLGPFLARLRAMFDDGLQRENCWFVDIPYSTNERVREEIRQLGVPAEQMSPPFRDPLAPYSKCQIDRVKDAIRKLSSRKSGCRLLVVDDGAYFIRAVTELRTASSAIPHLLQGKTAIVEQTTRGSRYLQEARYCRTVEQLEAPVVSVARCRTKIQFEGPFIGAAVSRSVVRALGRAGRLEAGLGRVAILGFGTVGMATFRALRSHRHDGRIDVVDTDTSKHGTIAAAGGTPSERLPRAKAYDLVVGCTGYGSFAWQDRTQLAQDAWLVSGSSAAVEFNRGDFIERANADPNDEIEVIEPDQTREQGIRATIRFRDGDRRFSFLHAGFPVNFDGQVECLPARMIQATHALLYSAGLQALRSRRPGVARIDAGDDAWILREALRRL